MAARSVFVTWHQHDAI